MACLRDEFWFTFSTWVCLKAESGRFDSHKRDAPFLTHFHARIFVHGVIDGFNYSLNHISQQIEVLFKVLPFCVLQSEMLGGMQACLP